MIYGIERKPGGAVTGVVRFAMFHSANTWRHRESWSVDSQSFTSAFLWRRIYEMPKMWRRPDQRTLGSPIDREYFAAAIIREGVEL